MASFVPQLDTSGQGEPQFVRPQSMGVETNKTTGSLLSGIADTAKMAVDTVDQTFKNLIKDEATARVDEARDALITDRKVLRDINQNVPVGLRRGLDTLARAKAASDAGVLSESYRDMQYDAISRDLRYKYAGYREYIDDSMHKLTGIQPANRLAEDLRTEAMKNANGEEKYTQTLRLDLMKQGIDIAGLEKANGGRPLPTDHMEQLFANSNKIKADSARLELQAKEMEVEKKSDDEVARKGTLLINEAMTQNAQFALNTMNKAVGMTNSSMEEFASRLQADPSAATPEMMENLKVGIGTVQQQVSKDTREFITKPGRDGKSLQTKFKLSNDAVNQMIKDQVDKATSHYQPLLNKDFGAFSANLRILEATKQGDDARLLANDVLSGHASVRRNLGDLVANSVATQSGGLSNLLTNVDKLAVQRGSQSILNGQARSLAQMDAEMRTNTNIKNLQVNQAAVTEAVTTNVVDIITNKDADLNAKLQATKAAFHRDNTAFIANIVVKKGDTIDYEASKAKQIEMYQKLSTKDVQNNVLKLGEIDPKIVSNYSNWATATGITLGKQTLDDVKATLIDRDAFAKIDFDPKTATFSYSERTPSAETLKKLSINSAGVNDTIRNTDMINANRLADKLNTIVRQIKPALEMNGSKDIAGELANRFNQFGFNINALSANSGGKLPGRMNLGLDEIERLSNASPQPKPFDGGALLQERAQQPEQNTKLATYDQVSEGMSQQLVEVKDLLKKDPTNQDLQKELDATMEALVGHLTKGSKKFDEEQLSRHADRARRLLVDGPSS